ncbi:MAG TPA: glucosidase [Myxococcota bacterium]|nr:glucosidase [Myxococcota bacterium]
MSANAEKRRLAEDHAREKHWKRWGPYLAERQWATVREDYSADGNCWDYFPHDHARSRAYRWGEDGLLGFSDHRARICFGLALWNERDPILKERLFGLTGPQGNHGEDVKENYYYLDSTPTHSHVRMLYKYPQAEYPYARLIEENRARSREQGEFELEHTGAFDESRYFDVFAEYAKASPNDLLIEISVANRGPEPARIHVLPQLWLRNTWAWGRSGESYPARGEIRDDGGALACVHPELGRFRMELAPGPQGAPDLLFTENETNTERLYGSPNKTAFVKDAFHERVVHGREDAVNPARAGSKAAAWYRLELAAGESATLRMRLSAESERSADALGAGFAAAFDARRREADAFYDDLLPGRVTAEERRVARQGYAGLLCSKQFYHLIAEHWLEGDPAQPPPPSARRRGRNSDWRHLYLRDVLSMPDKWEYPWFAAWDLATHMIPFAKVDPHFAKEQLQLLLREWYLHPNGQLPAYEFSFSDVNAPLHAWAAWRVYKIEAPAGKRDRAFLASVFQKLLLNFTWWVNRKDPHGDNLFGGGFLGLDNIGVFDRSQPLPTGGHLEQADGTAWMAFFSATMLAIALELAQEEPIYEDMASKFFEHFVAIVDAMNTRHGDGLWDEQDGFYYDELHADGQEIPLRVRSMVGLLPLLAVEVLDDAQLAKTPGFRKRMEWFLRNRPELARHVTSRLEAGRRLHLLSIPDEQRLRRVLRYLLDEGEFLAPNGLRSLSRFHQHTPYVFWAGGAAHRVDYLPAESDSGLFGGNSNWRGPIWFPVNYLLVEALERFGHFYGDSLRVECPVGSGRALTLAEVARELAQRLSGIFRAGPDGARPWHRQSDLYRDDPHFRELNLFHEYFCAETGRGLGASHQTGWTALVVRLIEDLARNRAAKGR